MIRRSLASTNRRTSVSVEAENVRELADNPAFELDSVARLTIGDRQLLRIDYRGAPSGQEEELQFLCIMYLRGRETVALTVTARHALWPEIREAVERAVNSLRFDREPSVRD